MGKIKKKLIRDRLTECKKGKNQLNEKIYLTIVPHKQETIYLKKTAVKIKAKYMCCLLKFNEIYKNNIILTQMWLVGLGV